MLTKETILSTKRNIKEVIAEHDNVKLFVKTRVDTLNSLYMVETDGYCAYSGKDFNEAIRVFNDIELIEYFTLEEKCDAKSIMTAVVDSDEMFAIDEITIAIKGDYIYSVVNEKNTCMLMYL